MILRVLAYLLGVALLCAAAAVYAYVVVAVMYRVGLLPPSIAGGLAPALAG